MATNIVTYYISASGLLHWVHLSISFIKFFGKSVYPIMVVKNIQIYGGHIS